MTKPNFPSPIQAHRHADMVVHAIGLAMILVVGWILIAYAMPRLAPSLSFAVVVYLLCALTSNLSSAAYHFTHWHQHRQTLRRIDHAAIYLSVTGTFTPFFVLAGTTWTTFLLWMCWGLTALAIWNKITNPTVKSRWSTASYLALGAIGLSAIPDMRDVPSQTLWYIVGGAISYVIGTIIYTRKGLPYRYSIWHMFVNIGALMMFIGIWIALRTQF